MKKKILYIDMDGVIVNFESGLQKIDDKTKKKYKKSSDIPGIFSLMKPIENSIETINRLSKRFDIFFLSTAPWNNPSSWSDKLLWIKKYFGDMGKKKLILSHRKDLNLGDFLIDDLIKHGAENFSGELIIFGSKKFPDWKSIEKYLNKKSKK